VVPWMAWVPWRRIRSGGSNSDVGLLVRDYLGEIGLSTVDPRIRALAGQDPNWTFDTDPPFENLLDFEQAAVSGARQRMQRDYWLVNG
jgi:hypothetical protein